MGTEPSSSYKLLKQSEDKQTQSTDVITVINYANAKFIIDEWKIDPINEKIITSKCTDRKIKVKHRNRSVCLSVDDLKKGITVKFEIFPNNGDAPWVEEYLFWCNREKDRIAMYITEKAALVRIINNTSSRFFVQHKKKHTPGSLLALHSNTYYESTTEESYLYEKAYGEYNSWDLKVFTNKGTLIKFRMKYARGYFYKRNDQIIDGFLITYDESTKRYTISDVVDS